MKINFIDRLSNAPKLPFFDLFDKKKAAKIGNEILNNFQGIWYATRGHNRGGIVSSTIDAMHAILSCLAPTMEDLRINQPTLYIETILTGKYFVFVNNGTISAKINQGVKFKHNRLKNRTVFNQIKRLLEAGFLTEKRNYSTRIDGKTGKKINPHPEDLNPYGNGRVQLFINPEVFQVAKKFEAQYKELLSYLRNTFPIDSSLLFSYSNDIEKVNSELECVKINKALANANNLKSKKGKEQASQFPRQSEISRAEMSEKEKKYRQQFNNSKDYQRKELLNLCCSLFFPNREFATRIREQALTALNDKLDLIEERIREYRKEEKTSYKKRSIYQKATEKKQFWMLEQYSKKLPCPQRSSHEILATAFQVQYTHAKNKGYYCKIQRSSNDPVQFITSSNLQHAIDYKIKDWILQNKNFFAKNKGYQVYQAGIKEVSKIYRRTLYENFNKGLLIGYVSAFKELMIFKEKISNALMSESLKKTLVVTLKNRLYPLYKVLTQKEKSYLVNCAINNLKQAK